MVWTASGQDEATVSARFRQESYFAEHPLIAEINLIAAALMEIIGPMLWAALIVLYICAEISPT